MGCGVKRLRVADVFCRVCDFPRFFAFILFVSLLSAVGLVFLIILGVLFGVWCFYMFQLAADQNFKLDEAFVESRKGVQRHGFWKHLILVCFVAILIGGGVQAAIEIFDEQGFAWIWLVPS